jgi:hypothetical protein
MSEYIKPLLILISISILFTFFIPVLSNPGICENCPQTECSIQCNTTINSQPATSTWNYFNYTINQETDVFIGIMNPMPPFQNYDLFANKTAGQCSTKNSCDKKSVRQMGYEDYIYFVNRPPGTYYFLVNCTNNCGNYNLNLTCAKFCGDGVWQYFEGCEPSVHDCRPPYQQCTRCECFDIRTEAKGCNYYDYCQDGMNVTDVGNYTRNEITFDQIKPCCNYTSSPAFCCTDGIIPVKNCSVTGAVRNISVTANPEYCYNQGYSDDTTRWNRCIDSNYRAHDLWAYC